MMGVMLIIRRCMDYERRRHLLGIPRCLVLRECCNDNAHGGAFQEGLGAQRGRIRGCQLHSEGVNRECWSKLLMETKWPRKVESVKVTEGIVFCKLTSGRIEYQRRREPYRLQV